MIDLGLLLTCTIILWTCWCIGENYTNTFIKTLLLAIGVSIFIVLIIDWVANPLAIINGCEIDPIVFKSDILKYNG